MSQATLVVAQNAGDVVLGEQTHRSGITPGFSGRNVDLRKADNGKLDAETALSPQARPGNANALRHGLYATSRDALRLRTRRVRLTPKQRRFIEEYLCDLNATQAAVRAGYSRRTAKEIGYENLTKPHIAEAVEKAFLKRTQRVEIDQDWVINRLVENAERAMQAVPVLDADGDAAGGYRYDGHVANRSLELIGKHLRMFRDDPQINYRTLNINSSDGVDARDELARLLRGIAARQGVEGDPAALPEGS